jgi:nucleotide-binding universal stress UspA family protein
MNHVAERVTPTATPFSIVVALDFTDADRQTFDQAVRVAQRIPGSELHLVHVFPEAPSQERAKDLVGHLRLYVNEKAAIDNCLRGITVGIHLRAGQSVREIVQFATAVSADLIVVGSHRGPHLKSWTVGTTAERLIVGAPCPVLVASPRPREPEKHEPTIEPPCPQCVEARKTSAGASWWCPRHTTIAARAHTYSYQREVTFATHDSAVFPTGIDF